LDFSVYGADRPETDLRAISIQGMAIDGVKKIRLLGDNGISLAEVPVRNNVYVYDEASPLPKVRSLAAIDSDNQVVYEAGLTGRSG
jgi:hypothetical protein